MRYKFFCTCVTIGLLSSIVFLATACADNSAPQSTKSNDLTDHDQANQEVFLRIFKQEQEFEVWTRNPGTTPFALLKTYPICKSSGDLGPKRREGDLQVPEGVYHIDRFNPNSQYHLSLGLNYPNRSDLIRGDAERPGSDIFIHGRCVTVGCVPLTDELIEEVYALCESAKEGGQSTIYVHVFPARMDDPAFIEASRQSLHRSFWEELVPIYTAFERERESLTF